jgi:hypothetical protein
MKAWKIAVLWSPLIAVACSEVQTVPTQVPASVASQIAPPQGPASRSIAVGSQSPPAGVPPEYQHYTSVDVSVDLGFDGLSGYGQALVTYGGNNGKAEIELVARNAQGTIVGSNSGHQTNSHVFPGDFKVTASTTLLLPTSCGHSLQAKATGTAWDSFIGANQSLLSWGKQEITATNSAAQAACPIATQPIVCKSSTISGAQFDCDSPTGGDGSTAPPTQTAPPEPPTYVEPYYQPKSGQWNCMTIYPGTDYEQYVCWWVENNDTRIGSEAAPRSTFRAGSPSSSATGATLPSVFVVVSDAVPAGAMAVVERRKQGPYKNVLLVPSANFRPAELVRAMRFLYASRAAAGETPLKEFSAELKGSVSDAEVSAAAREYAASFTTLLSKAKGGIAGPRGTSPFLEIRMGDAPAK